MNEIKKNDNVAVIKHDSGLQHQRLIEIAVSSNVDIEKLERLLDLQTKWEQKEAKKAFTKAMTRFQSQCPTIKKSKQGHNYKYAPMCDVMEQVKGLEGDCGLSHRFEQESKGDEISITCIVSHIDGHSESLKLEALADKTGSKNAVQAIGSTIAYLQRYSFLGSFGIATADEDMDGRIPSVAQEKQSVTPDNQKLWNNAKNAYLRDGNFEAVLKRANISEEHQELIKNECV